METIAIYWEKQVKVYGIIVKNGLTLVNLQQSREDTAPWHTLLSYFEMYPVKFELVTSFPDHSSDNSLSFILDSEQLLIFQTNLKAIQQQGRASFVLSYKKTDLIYLHGPHFQERFGILSKALEPLCAQQIQITLSGCAGNSMYIVVPEGLGKISSDILQRTFHTPQSA